MNEIIESITILLVMLIIIALIGFGIYSTISYWNLTDIIEKCNTDFGEGNWSFTQTNEYYSCQSYSRSTFVYTSTSKQCFENDIKIDCEDLD